MLIPTIGIEVHAELKSKNKVFSSSLNNFKDAPNTNISLIDLAYPGTLPILNKEVIDMALKAAIVLNCKINRIMHFDRKNYFYPDLPKGYQITQKNTPIGYDGYININVDGVLKRIEIEEIHIEEDTCKSIHVGSETLLNYNRAGIPLIEIVTKPVIKSAKEAVLYLEALREQLLYLDISDVKIEEGSMRCDANVSVKEEAATTLGTKAEIKNIGSISNVATSINYEIKRQIEVINNGEKVIEETRRFDDKTGTTKPMRIKETGNDYRYFPEPDIPYIEITDSWFNKVKSEIPLLPDFYKNRYQELSINNNNIKTIIANRELNEFFFKLIDKCNPVIAANLLTGDILSLLNKSNLKIAGTKLDINDFINLVNKREANLVSSNQCKEIISYLIEGKKLEEVIKEMNIEIVNDDSFLTEIISKIVLDNKESVKDYKEGKERAIKFLMGQVMKESKGKINPKTAISLLIDTLNNL